MVDALKRASRPSGSPSSCRSMGMRARTRSTAGREPISARLMADMFKTAGADRLMAVDLHTDQIQGFFDGPVDHLHGTCRSWPTTSRSKYGTEKITVVSPDAGRIKVAEQWSERLGGAPLAFIHKTRDVNAPQRERRQPRHRSRRGPDLHSGRRHDRHRWHDRQGRGCADGRRCRRRRHRRDARDLLRPGRATAARLGAREVVVTDTLPIAPEKRFASSPCCRSRRCIEPGDPRGVRGRLGHQPVQRPRLTFIRVGRRVSAPDA